jgi:hypothetical protein
MHQYFGVTFDTYNLSLQSDAKHIISVFSYSVSIQQCYYSVLIIIEKAVGFYEKLLLLITSG